MKILLLESYPINNPIDISVGSARTCYSETLKTPEDIKDWKGKQELLLDLFKSGHHTTLQHVNFTFLMEDITRLSIWRFFHSHRFYNSDQVSQRYTKVQETSFKKFNNEEINLYHINLIDKYNELINIFTPMFEASNNKVVQKLAKKKAMENARYILPQSIFANMYHTVNLSTLLRYKAFLPYLVDCKEEISEIVNKMVNLVIIRYPELEEIFNYVESKSTDTNINIYKDQTNSLLKSFLKNNKKAIIVNHTNFQGIKSIDNYFSGDTFGLSALFNSELGFDNFTCDLKLSLSADSQNQRHRTAYSIRPELKTMIENNRFEYYIPDIFKENKKALEIYENAIKNSEEIAKKYPDFAPYFLLNGYMITIRESNSCLDFIHKAEKRLCLNSQEEITKLTWNIVEELVNDKITSNFGKMLAPPCYYRYKKNINPICPEGSRFCGVKEWKNPKYS